MNAECPFCGSPGLHKIVAGSYLVQLQCVNCGEYFAILIKEEDDEET